MAPRRTKPQHGTHLTVVHTPASPGVEPLEELRRVLQATGAPESVVDALADAATPAQAVQALVTALRALAEAAGAPEPMLRAFDGLEGHKDPQQLLDALIDSGLLPSPLDCPEELVEEFKALLLPGTTALEAELFGAEFYSMIRACIPDDEVPDVVAELIGHAEASDAPQGLAMLRVLAALGPASLRPQAAQAAERLMATGIKDRPWAAVLGRPHVGACFGYTDPQGTQEALACTFTYGRKSHAGVILIDHELGGGVKDCFFTDDPAQACADMKKVARHEGLAFHSYTPAQASAIAERALSNPVCPVEPDQIEDIEDYLDLLRSRIALLAPAPTQQPNRKDTHPTPFAPRPTVRKVKITLRGIRPPIWRRLEVPSDITLGQLHQAIQAAFGWAGYHMWVFETPLGHYGIADRELGHRSAAAKKLAEVAPHPGDRLRYTYDFGDDWEHDLLIEDIGDAEPGVTYPRCLTGRRACPPEDSGGVWGYGELLEILADPAHPEHAERLEWLGLTSATDFDPAAFDLQQINAALSELARVLIKR